MTATPPSSVSALSDFPDWMGPMWVKELRQGLRRNLFLINFLLLHLTMCGWVVFMMAGDEELISDWGEVFFWVILALGLSVIPFRALGVISSEKKEQTFELIQLSSLSPWQIVFGKWSALMLQALLLTVSLLPYACIRYFFGKVHLVYDSLTVAVMLGISAILVACGVLMSSLNRYGVILVILACIVVAPFVLGFLIVGIAGFAGYFYQEYAELGIFAFPFYAVLYSLMILNFVALPMAGPLESNTVRMKLLGWLMLLPAFVSFFFCESSEVPMVLTGAGVLGVIIIVFYSLGAATVPGYQAEAMFRRYGFWGRCTAWLLAPSSESGARNALSLVLMTAVGFLFPFWMFWTGFPPLMAIAWFFICFFAGVLLPWTLIHFLRRWVKGINFLGLWFWWEIILAAYTVVIAGVIVNGSDNWLRVAVCATPFGSLFLAAEQKEITLESVAFIIAQWIAIAVVFWLRRPPKIGVAMPKQQGGAV